MKAIAEYFRDLAADDRYFGAEPPTPDADMLARIAEREIARRVDAHEQEGKIVLRAAEDAALNAPATPEQETEPKSDAPSMKEEADAPAPVDQPETEPAPEQDRTADEAPEAEPMPEPAEEPVTADLAETEPDSEPSPEVTEAVAEGTEEPALESDGGEAVSEPEATHEVAPEPIAEDEPEAEADAIQEAEAEPEPEDTAATEEPAEEDMATLASMASLGDEPVEDVAPETDAAPVEPEAEDAAGEGDSVADRLRRIRSLVQDSDSGFEDTVYSEDEHAQDFLSETAADLDEVLSEDDAAETAAQDETEEPDFSAVLDAVEARTPIQEPVEAPKPEPKAEEFAEDTLAQLLADAMPEEAEEPADEAEVSEDDEERPLVQARVVKMKRSEFEAAIAEGYIEEDGDEDLDSNLFGDDSGLSAEEEAELQRELAEVEAEFGESEQAEDSETADKESAPLRLTEEEQVQDLAEDEGEEPSEEAEPEQTPRGISKLERAERQADLARIFDEADTQLEAPESNKRRSAIQHLRAAVAATRAEKNAGASLKEDVDDTPYRSDLASVVRPRRPEPGEGRPRASRPSVKPSAPAPLKLVAEQRVDVDSTPVRPRRVSTADLADVETVSESGGNFSEFAEEMGVRGLPELLEAAAAYMSDVEGRAQFSRPMLMGKLKEVEGSAFSREDGLRTFGQLLRQGKLQKLKGGRFSVTESTDFRAETRNAG
ncbi:hypothetical protein FDP25_08985 [Roseovarius sp. A21]|uniref:Uncharacterized protein n=1 Tax=Roseovarius bejariae TaxID=2576383 RepID=A0A844CLP7_9RHOB|nr:hypothetical protein [Roseovarius bejariae]MRU15562.1 hypothetical protein [Roseovarius bejariae]